MVNLNYFHLNVIIRTFMNNADKFTNFLGCLDYLVQFVALLLLNYLFTKPDWRRILMFAILFILLFEE